MSLPTPPATAHRLKEKEAKEKSLKGRISWAAQEQVREHTPHTSPKRPSTKSAHRLPPIRGILKPEPCAPALPFSDDESFSGKAREETPEPEDALADLDYLEWPVSQILKEDVSLRELVEAYSVLAARLRGAVDGNTEAETSWPLLRPLRRFAPELVSALVRDLGRALEDPLGEDNMKCDEVLLPSPRRSPGKKGGMTEAQVKRARDLVGTTHAAIKFLVLALSAPAIYSSFADDALGEIVTALLAIPLAPSLPTPNARKTCALAVWLVQSQRLPEDVLMPARDRVAYALRRAIEGELGKEGKKGSMSDGLKAIHDLSIHAPAVFVPAFAELLPSILTALTHAPTLALRAMAAHALGGLALGASRLPASWAHTRLHDELVHYLEIDAAPTPAASPSKSSSPIKSPSKTKSAAMAMSDTPLMSALRAALKNERPLHAVQGPVWALSILASFAVLLGSGLAADRRLTHLVAALASLGARHHRSTVRSLTMMACRALSWAWHRPPLLTGEDEEPYKEDEVYLISGDEDLARKREATWKFVAKATDMGAGIAAVGAVLASPYDDEPEVRMRRVVHLLREMVSKSGLPTQEALEVLARLVGAEKREVDDDGEEIVAWKWDWSRLLSPPLFSPNTGLFHLDLGTTLAGPLRAMYDRTPGEEHIRALHAAELAAPGTLGGLLDLWRVALTTIVVREDIPFPEDILTSWDGIVTRGIEVFSACTSDEMDDSEDESVAAELVADFGLQVVNQIISLLKDTKLDLVLDPSAADTDPESEAGVLPGCTPTSTSKSYKKKAKDTWRSNESVKLEFARYLWKAVVKSLPDEPRAHCAETFARYLMEQEPNLVCGGDAYVEDERAQWSGLCAEVMVHAPEGVLRDFWSLPGSTYSPVAQGKKGRRSSGKWDWRWPASTRAAVYTVFMQTWCTLRAPYSQTLSLLTHPFSPRTTWDMSSLTTSAWEACLDSAIDVAWDDGVETVSVLDSLASRIGREFVVVPGGMGIWVVDALFGRMVDETEMCGTEEEDGEDVVPGAQVYVLAAETLSGAYPPTEKMPAAWLLRTLAQRIDHAPKSRLRAILSVLVEPLSTWLRDEEGVYSEDEYAFEMQTVLETILVCARTLPLDSATAEILAPLAEAVYARPTGAAAFVEFWAETFGSAPIPEEGWPKACLKILPGYASPEEDVEMDDLEPGAHLADTAFDLDDEEAEVEREVIDVDAVDDEQEVTVPPSTPLRRTVELELPSTPARPSTPPPRRTPKTPNMHVTPRTPRTPGSAARRNKENEATPAASASINGFFLPAPPTVHNTPRLPTPRMQLAHATSLPNRLAALQASPTPSNAKSTKRRASDTFEAPPPPKRHLRESASGRVLFANTPHADHTLFAPPSEKGKDKSRESLKPSPSFAVGKSPFGRTGSNGDVFKRAGSPTPLKRGVPEPSALGNDASVERELKRVRSPSPFPPGATSIVKRKRSIVEVLLPAPGTARRIHSAPVRRKPEVEVIVIDDSDEDDDEEPMPSSSPLRALGDLPALASDDSIMHPATPRRAPMSSDDEPIAARGVLSPSMRRSYARVSSLSALSSSSRSHKSYKRTRVQEDSSDEEAASSDHSPSSEHVARKLARSASDAAVWTSRSGKDKGMVLPGSGGARARVLRPARVLAGLPDDADVEY
ncbi:hypothetical protein PENSPDRAFT_749951 [Peniophora sp. CONT]|nr:hypothetical protein PENSPDRAFT_749951 [Peniophora sp. CONT]